MKFSNAKREGELIFQVWSGKKKGGNQNFPQILGGNQSLTHYALEPSGTKLTSSKRNTRFLTKTICVTFQPLWMYDWPEIWPNEPRDHISDAHVCF